jgi:multiple sugar transport system permease protein
VWRVLLLQEWGIINQILTKLGLMHEKVTWLSSLAMFSLILVRIWTVFPFVMITLLAGLQTINPEEYEAAQIDGANAIQRFRYITLPGISIVSKIMLLLLFIWGTGEFNAPYILFDKSPPQSAMLLSVHIYKYSFDMWDFAHGTAMSTVMLIIMFSFASIYAKLMVKDVN